MNKHEQFFSISATVSHWLLRVGGPEAKLAELHHLQMTSALCQAALVMYKFIVGLQIPSQILLGLQHNAERRHRAQRSPVAAPKQTHKGRRGRRSSEQK